MEVQHLAFSKHKDVSGTAFRDLLEGLLQESVMSYHAPLAQYPDTSPMSHLSSVSDQDIVNDAQMESRASTDNSASLEVKQPWVMAQ